MRGTALILVSLGAASAFPLGPSYAGWLRLEDASNRASMLSLAKDQDFRNKHEKKQAKKQQEREKENAGSSTPNPPAPGTACGANSNVLWGDYCYTKK